MIFHHYRGVAQLVEHRIPNPTVPGSSPGAPAIQSTLYLHFLFAVMPAWHSHVSTNGNPHNKLRTYSTEQQNFMWFSRRLSEAKQKN